MDLFDLSITKGTPYTELLVKKPQYRTLVTFSQNKNEPIYNWFYYKEGFSKELIQNLLKELKIKKGGKILDPFCGTGNSLLASKQLGYNALGIDVLPLAIFVSNTKLQDDYNLEELYKEIKNLFKKKFGETSLKFPELGFLDFKQAFSRYARNDLLFFKEKIFQVENEKIRNFLFLGLLSIVGEASNTKKDGGVLRIVKKKHLAPVRYLLKNRLKRMYKDIKKVNPKKTNIIAEAREGDSKNLNLKEKFDFCVTSPPYLNFVDYTKLYGLELALLLNNKEEILEIRKRAIKSFVGLNFHDEGKKEKKRIRSEILDETITRVKKEPLVVSSYFQDMYLSLKNIYNVMNVDTKVAIVIANTCLPEITIDSDLILSEISENLGFKAIEIWVVNARWCTVHGIKKDKPVRESILILEK